MIVLRGLVAKNVSDKKGFCIVKYSSMCISTLRSKGSKKASRRALHVSSKKSKQRFPRLQSRTRSIVIINLSFGELHLCTACSVWLLLCHVKFSRSSREFLIFRSVLKEKMLKNVKLAGVDSFSSNFHGT